MSCRHTDIKTLTRQRSSNINKLKEDHLQPGDYILLDQYESSTHGRLSNSKGQEAESDKFCGGAIAVDRANGKMWIIIKSLFELGKL